jgi:hypothetical protein
MSRNGRSRDATRLPVCIRINLHPEYINNTRCAQQDVLNAVSELLLDVYVVIGGDFKLELDGLEGILKTVPRLRGMIEHNLRDIGSAKVCCPSSTSSAREGIGA